MTDFSDHKIWQLLLTVGVDRLDALFYDRQCRVFEPFMHRTWGCDPAEALSKIQDAVYEAPTLLDDYDTKILLRPTATLLVPPEMVDPDDTEANARALDAVDASEHKDVWCEPLGEAMALYSTPDGVRDFLSRSFLTEDVHHVLCPMVAHFAATATAQGGHKMWVHVGEDLLDAVAWKDGRLVLGASWHFKGAADAAYYIMLAWNTLSLDPAQGQLQVSGTEDTRRELLPMLRRHINYVSLTLVSQTVASSLRQGVGLAQAFYMTD